MGICRIQIFGGIMMAILLIAGCLKNDSQQQLPTVPMSDSVESGLFPTPQIVQLGEVRLNSSHPFEVELTNRSSESYSQIGVQSSCGCTRLRISSPVCASDDQITLTGIVHIPAERGIFRHRLIIQSGLPERQHCTILLEGTAVSAFTLVPDVVTVEPDYLNGLDGRAVVAVTNSLEREVTFAVSTVPAKVIVEPRTYKIPPKGEVLVGISVHPEVIESMNTPVVFGTSESEENIVTIPVRIEPKYPVRVSPREIRLGVVSRTDLGSLLNMPLRVSLTGKGFSIFDIDSIDLPVFLKQSGQLNSDGTGYLAQFSYFDRADGGFSLNGEIVFHLISKSTPLKRATVRIPVTGVITE